MNNIIKQILVQLAIDGKLPLDMNDLDENIFSTIPSDILLSELKERKYLPENCFTINDIEIFDKKEELTLDEKYEILNNVMNDDDLVSQIIDDLFYEWLKEIDKKKLEKKIEKLSKKMNKKFPTLSEFNKKAEIARKILYKNDFALYNLELFYKNKKYDESYYKTVKEIRNENINPYNFLEIYNRGNFKNAFDFWDFELNETLFCENCGDLHTNI